MIFQQVTGAFTELGKSMERWVNEGHPDIEQAYFHNNWFTTDSVKRALMAWSRQLGKLNLEKWTGSYSFKPHAQKTIAVIMAGNIPLVGLHDLLCALLSGNKVVVKPSEDDTILVKLVIDELIRLNPDFSELIHISDGRLPKEFDAVIATGSNNSNRYFEYYFKDKPHLLRKNRSSTAVITGNETPEDLRRLGDDIFTYFGLGCRNVSKLFVPQNYDFKDFFEGIESHKEVIQHNKYANNYWYHKTIFSMNLQPHFDNGFLLIKEDEQIASPLSVVFYETYETMADVQRILDSKQEEIQCIIGKTNGFTPLGTAQEPELWDYADGVDTLSFCIAL